MSWIGLDHIVLAVADIERTKAFYSDLLGADCVEQKPGHWALVFGRNRISLQKAGALPPIARNTLPGTGNFCLLTDEPVEDIASRLRSVGVAILEGPASRIGAAGALNSVYFNDPDGNLVEVSNLIAG